MNTGITRRLRNTSWILFLLCGFSFGAFGQTNYITATMTACASTSNTISYDVNVQNTSSQTVYYKSHTLRFTMLKSILPTGATLAVTYNAGSGDAALSALIATYSQPTPTVGSSTIAYNMTTGNVYAAETAPALAAGASFKIGRFTITCSQNWVANSSSGTAWQAAGSAMNIFLSNAPGTPTTILSLTTGASRWTQGAVCTLTGLNGCTVPTLSTSITNVACNGGTNGAIDLTTTGGSSPFTYSWTKVGGGFTASTEDITGLAAGTYNVTVTATGGCTATGSYTVTQPATALSASESHTAVLCNGGSSTVTISATGGTGPYTGTGNFSQSAGTQSYNVTDFNGCTTSVSVTVTQPTALSASESHTAVLCNGGSSTVTISASGGTPPYTGTGNFNQSAGTQSYNVTDFNGCTTSVFVTVTQPTALSASESHTAVACNGGSSTVTISASGGTPPYTGTGNFNQSAGTQSYNVTDFNGCTTSVSVTVTQPTALSASESHTAVACNGGSSTVTISATGGTGPYTGTGNFNQSAGTQSYNVTDFNGCTTSVSVTVTQPTALSASESHTAVACNGGSSTVTISATGGTGPYTGTGNFNQSAGTQSYNVTDFNGCTTSVSVTVTEPTALSVTTTSTNTTCVLICNDGTATANPSGGTPNYTYLWDDPGAQTTQTATGLAPGSYTVTVTDANGCSTTAGASVNQPVCTISVTASKTDATCNGGNNGTATANVSGAIGTVSYIWNTTPAQHTQTATGLSAGNYTVTVTDNAGCSASANVTVGEPDAIIVTATPGTISCNGGTTSVVVSATGGTGILTGTGTFNNVGAGSHTYNVTDANSCSGTTTINISEPSAISVTATPGTISCNGGTTSVVVSATGGTGTLTGTGTFNNVTAGTYTYTVTDANSCTGSAMITISQPNAIIVTAMLGTISCNGGTTSVVVSATGGTGTLTGTGTFNNVGAGSHTYNVTDANSCSGTTTINISEPSAIVVTATPGNICNNGTTSVVVTATGGTGTLTGTGTFNDVGPGTYTYTVMDDNHCSGSATITINNPSAIVVTATPGAIQCNGGTTSVVVSATGGSGTYTSGTGTFTNVSAGTYTYTVTDNTGCTGSVTKTISQPAAIVVTAGAGTITCVGGKTFVAVSATGGSGTYVSGTGRFAHVSAGTYTYTVTDNNGCTGSATITVADGTGTKPNKPGAISGQSLNLCAGGAYTYSINPVATATSYNWTVPASFTVLSNTGTSITVSIPAGLIVSSISVTASNTCGTSKAQSLSLYGKPYAPVISGATMVAAQQTNVPYSVTNSVAGQTYTWTTSANSIKILSGQNTPNITVKFGNISGTIYCQTSNGCGSSTKTAYPVTVGGGGKMIQQSGNNTPEIFTVSPNPTQGISKVIFSAVNEGKYSIELRDIAGKVLLVKEGTAFIGENQVDINVAGYANGMYFVSLINDDGRKTIKLVKDN